MGQLPNEQRTVMMLCYYDECSIQEIVSITGAEFMAKSRLNHARKALEKLILKREKQDKVRSPQSTRPCRSGCCSYKGKILPRIRKS